MPWGNRLHCALAACLVLACLVLFQEGKVVSQQPAPQPHSTPAAKPLEKPDDGVVFPPNRSVLLSGDFDVICRTTEDAPLDVEGEIVAWEPFEPPLRGP